MNQSLINEIRALSIQIGIRINKVASGQVLESELTSLLLAQSNCMNAIAVLVAANKK